MKAGVPKERSETRREGERTDGVKSGRGMTAYGRVCRASEAATSASLFTHRDRHKFAAQRRETDSARAPVARAGRPAPVAPASRAPA
jgi:hypothetical protein